MKLTNKISISWMIFISLLIFDIYVILSVGMELLPQFKVSWTETFTLKFNNVILNISYSYVAAVFFYLLINYIPKQSQKRRFQPYVKRDIKRIHILYLDLVNSMDCNKNSYENIPDLKTFEELMTLTEPNELYPRTIGQITEATYMKTFFYTKVETERIIEHIYLFKEHTPDNIISLVEELKHSTFFRDIVMWNSWRNGVGNKNMQAFAESFYDGFDIVEKLNLEGKSLYK